MHAPSPSPSSAPHSSGSRGSRTPPPAGSSSGLSGSQLAAAIAVPVVVTVVLAAALAAAVVVIVRKRKAGGWGAVAPPGADPGTTLLLTDIQNSTGMPRKDRGLLMLLARACITCKGFVQVVVIA